MKAGLSVLLLLLSQNVAGFQIITNTRVKIGNILTFNFQSRFFRHEQFLSFRVPVNFNYLQKQEILTAHNVGSVFEGELNGTGFVFDRFLQQSFTLLVLLVIYIVPCIEKLFNAIIEFFDVVKVCANNVRLVAFSLFQNVLGLVADH